MPTTLEVILSPAEFSSLSQRDLRAATGVVFDVLRATTTMVTALASGAEAVIPVAGIPEALAARTLRPDLLLAGERDGLRIRAALTGGVDFDLGNSPREFTPEKVAGRTIVMTTTNGTRALRACAGAGTVLAASFVNLSVMVAWLAAHNPAHLLLVCAGTAEEPALEDVLAAGAVCEALWPRSDGGHVSDAAQMARLLYRRFAGALTEAARFSRNAQRLLGLPELRDDVAFCLERDTIPLVAALQPDGRVTRISGFTPGALPSRPWDRRQARGELPSPLPEGGERAG
jgi:2-phosphosulfolactate phosphatase